MVRAIWIGIAVSLSPPLLGAPARGGEAPGPAEIRTALERALVQVQGAASRYPSHRDCFSCHHQTLPAVAMVAARRAGVAIDEALLVDTVEFSAESFRRQLGNLRRGTGIGGRAMTVSYGLWTFREPDRPADELSEAMAGFLLKTQESDGRWTANPSRPPLEDSEVMSTVLATLALRRYATPGQGPASDRAIASARRWLGTAAARSQEDRNARLWGLWALEPDEGEWADARQAVLEAQRPDGGWAQQEGMESDAYATGQSLAILHWTGLDADDGRYRRGVRFLLDAQQADGSWRVETRSRPIQEDFDNGDPHGKSQFISTPATCWAAMALAGALEGP